MPVRPTPTAIAADNAARRILIDDGYSIRVDAAAHVGEQPYFTKNTVVRLGDTLVPPGRARWCSATASTSGGCSRRCR